MVRLKLQTWDALCQNLWGNTHSFGTQHFLLTRCTISKEYSCSYFYHLKKKGGLLQTGTASSWRSNFLSFVTLWWAHSRHGLPGNWHCETKREEQGAWGWLLPELGALERPAASPSVCLQRRRHHRLPSRNRHLGASRYPIGKEEMVGRKL